MALFLVPVWLTVWAASIAVKLPTVILGWFIVPFLYRYRYTDIDMMPIWSIPWVNPEDWHGGHLNNMGSLPTWWKLREGNDFWSFYKYHARRNPADGLRNIPWLQLWIEKDKVKYWTPDFYDHYEPWFDRTPGWRGYVAWQGIYAGVKLQWVRKNSYSEFKFGFRVEPRDAVFDLPDTSARKHLGASFASKLVLHREL